MAFSELLFIKYKPFTIITILLFLPCIFNQKRKGSYTNEWAVQINGNEKEVEELASKYGFVYHSKIINNYYLFKHKKVFKRSIKESISKDVISLKKNKKILWSEQQKVLKRVKRNVILNDMMWPKMWHLNSEKKYNMEVLGAWKQNFSGRGVVVTIPDDGMETNHLDLIRNYDAKASYDFNDDDDDPQMRYDEKNENRHGTRCAGEVAAQANNSLCSVGVAYNARIGAIRMLDGDVSDIIEARSFSFNRQYIDIYCINWGPEDDGLTVEGPGHLAQTALEEGVKLGRGGKGSIFIWATGNGGKFGDSCNCDGYTSNIYTLSIASVSEFGRIPWYSEACSSTLASTFSSGGMDERKIITTDLRSTCTNHHTGTSASSPLAAGIVALVLEANSELSWRDVQHIVVITSRKADLMADDWALNGAKRMVSHHFGYGLMSAEAMVQLAKEWTGVPRQHVCILTPQHESRGKYHNKSLDGQNVIEESIWSDACEGQEDRQIRYLEHVKVVITLRSNLRGDLQVHLYSPMGTRSTLLARRENDNSSKGFTNWSFVTTHCWGEDGRGVWKLEVVHGNSQASLISWSLMLYGTSEMPAKLKELIKKYIILNSQYHYHHHHLHYSRHTDKPKYRRNRNGDFQKTRVSGITVSYSSYVSPSINSYYYLSSFFVFAMISLQIQRFY